MRHVPHELRRNAAHASTACLLGPGCRMTLRAASLCATWPTVGRSEHPPVIPRFATVESAPFHPRGDSAALLTPVRGLNFRRATSASGTTMTTSAGGLSPRRQGGLKAAPGPLQTNP